MEHVFGNVYTLGNSTIVFPFHIENTNMYLECGGFLISGNTATILPGKTHNLIISKKEVLKQLQDDHDALYISSYSSINKDRTCLIVYSKTKVIDNTFDPTTFLAGIFKEAVDRGDDVFERDISVETFKDECFSALQSIIIDDDSDNIICQLMTYFLKDVDYGRLLSCLEGKNEVI
jgi:hypothetical protein